MSAPEVLPVGLRLAISKQGTTSILELAGEWDLSDRDAARDAMAQVLEDDPECVVLDLSGLTFIDSSGIHLMALAAERAHQRNIHVAIIPGPPQVQRVFDICGLKTVLPFTSRA